MCILVWVLSNVHPDVDFLLLDARDEVLDRPTTDTHYDEGTGVIAGWDQVSGGTWAGYNAKTGQWAVLTNVRAAKTYSGSSSRGHLVKELIEGDVDAVDWSAFAGYNVLYGNANAPESVTSVSKGVPGTANEDQFVGHQVWRQGVHGVSNSYVDDDSWPKVKWLKMEVTRILSSVNDLKAQLTDAQTWANSSTLAALAAALSARPNFDASTHPTFDSFLPPEVEAKLQSTVFVRDIRNYGTRSQCIWLQPSGNGDKRMYYACRNTEDECHGHEEAWIVYHVDVNNGTVVDKVTSTTKTTS